MKRIEFDLTTAHLKDSCSAVKVIDQDGVYVSAGGSYNGSLYWIMIKQVSGCEIDVKVWEDYSAYASVRDMVKAKDTQGILKFVYDLLSQDQIVQMISDAYEAGRRKGKTERSAEFRKLLDDDRSW